MGRVGVDDAGREADHEGAGVLGVGVGGVGLGRVGEEGRHVRVRVRAAVVAWRRERVRVRLLGLGGLGHGGDTWHGGRRRGWEWPWARRSATDGGRGGAGRAGEGE